MPTKEKTNAKCCQTYSNLRNLWNTRRVADARGEIAVGTRRCIAVATGFPEPP
jgi:hypothetical protein